MSDSFRWMGAWDLTDADDALWAGEAIRNGAFVHGDPVPGPVLVHTPLGLVQAAVGDFIRRDDHGQLHVHRLN